MSVNNLKVVQTQTHTHSWILLERTHAWKACYLLGVPGRARSFKALQNCFP